MVFRSYFSLLCVFLLLSVAALAQEAELYGIIKDNRLQPIEGATIAIERTATGVISDNLGRFSLKIPANEDVSIVIHFVGYEYHKEVINIAEGSRQKLDINLKEKAINIKEFVIEEERLRATPMTKIDPKVITYLPSSSGNFESILFSQPGVSSNNELSSQYSVRGGNFDENLVYVNDIQIYRPFLIRSGQQEGLSFINSNLVEAIEFSAGGFEARFGDKMSSVLDIRYKKPESFAGSVSASLLGGSAHVEDASDNHRFTQIHGIRYKTNRYILGGLDTDGSYQPSFLDYQGYFTYDITEKVEISFLGNISQNKYQFIPETRESDFGTVNEGLRLTVFFEGQEVDAFTTYLGAFSTDIRPNKNIDLKFIASAYKTREEETFDILGQYWLDELEKDLSSENFGDVAFNRGVGSFLNHGRNSLNALITSIEHKGKWYKRNNVIQWGLKGQQETVADKLSEWTMIDSAGYSIPQAPSDQILLNNVYKADTSITSQRLLAFGQLNRTFELKDTSSVTYTIGARTNYWSFNNQWLFSPRATLAYTPKWKRNFVFKAAVGVYHQPPFYREMRDLNGKINTDIKAQRSIHAVLASDYNFEMWDRPFKLTNELYYKLMHSLIPYEIDNVRIRYYGTNSAKGFAYGIDSKIHGEFVKGVDSWASISVMTIQEDIENDVYIEYQDKDGNKVRPFYQGTSSITDTVVTYPGYIPRPTDQRVNFGLFFQDYIPKHPNFKMHLNLLYGTGLPTGPPSFERFKDTLRIPPYRRVDIGFSAQLFGEKSKVSDSNPLKHFKSIWLSAEVFNLLQINNTISYLWIKDVSGRSYAVPNYLTSRRINIKLVANF